MPVVLRILDAPENVRLISEARGAAAGTSRALKTTSTADWKTTKDGKGYPLYPTSTGHTSPAGCGAWPQNGEQALSLREYTPRRFQDSEENYYSLRAEKQ